jgi:methylated-DNA-[protein]-cysteine S-methyltransferase
LGWMALVCEGARLKQLVFGYPTKASALGALNKEYLAKATICKADLPLVDRLRAYTEGKADNFSDIRVDIEEKTAFQRKVLENCREIPVGKTMTYGELAAKAGFPGAARAVGSCMARNGIPLIIPCHRVVSSNGRLGNYSAPGGIETKKRLLEMERRSVATPESK